ncbi:MAG: cupredoxin domain-containing protein [Candidatus Dormibacteria bacterium]
MVELWLGACALAALAGCSNGSGSLSSTGTGRDAGSAGVNIGTPAQHVAATDQLTFSPTTQTVHVGDIVQWTNDGTVPHTVTFETQPHLTDPSNLDPGDTWEVKFSEAGTFFYYCSIHPGMAGALVVTPRAG